MQKVWEFFKKETVLCIAGVLAVGSMLLVPPSAAYVGYIDFRVLGLLFCLMTVVAGLQGCGVFTKLAHQVVGRAKSLRSLCRALVLLCFFSSMLITNDVALITFVPFGIMVLSLIGQRSCLIWLVVLQTVAANLGSMLTPFGNPQNLYLYAQYNMGLVRFFALTLPIAALSLVLLLLLVQVIPAEPVQLALQEEATCSDRRRLTGYLVLGAVSILTVFRVLPWQAAVASMQRFPGRMCSAKKRWAMAKVFSPGIGSSCYIMMITAWLMYCSSSTPTGSSRISRAKLTAVNTARYRPDWASGRRL